MVSAAYDTPSEDESGGTASPIDIEPRESPATGSGKRRLAPSGSSQREAKSRRTGEPGEMSTPGQQGGLTASGSRGPGGGSQPPGYGSQSMSVHGMIEEGYGTRQKRDEFVDQKLMDDLKKDLGDPLDRQLNAVQADVAAAARSPQP
ncbi:SubName: Full=Uncharacterized protein {ECO:0000313/EMBL:CCA70968.1} [Serendipita indica DSM 11827]|uniref:Uncharacterized protein n=1 Tax=Serendipita indica (strain DSM 11827) TaxID=1109443 RepID=G4TI25_SERID|nr:SubName: Full=Uncharacterized protein {ECO:0000313/EMBL:CCA70968.1} [Serendipita indica DSM 11827]CCA70968.1 hypothetical protein PIIN_04901 [Serendipita indica DSM 11827]